MEGGDNSYSDARERKGLCGRWLATATYSRNERPTAASATAGATATTAGLFHDDDDDDVDVDIVYTRCSRGEVTRT